MRQFKEKPKPVNAQDSKMTEYLAKASKITGENLGQVVDSKPALQFVNFSIPSETNEKINQLAKHLMHSKSIVMRDMLIKATEALYEQQFKKQ